MVEFSHKETGLVELKLTELPSEAQLNLEFDHDLLQRLVTRTQNLQTLQVSNVADITETAKQNFLPIIFQIIEQNCKTLSNLNLSKFSKNADEGKQILSMISSGEFSNLENLDFGGYVAWF